MEDKVKAIIIEGTVKEIIEILAGLGTRMGGGGRSGDPETKMGKMGGGGR